MIEGSSYERCLGYFDCLYFNLASYTSTFSLFASTFRLNGREWWLIGLGTLGAIINGSMFPLFALFFGEVLEVFSLPSDEVFGEIHLWAGLFILLGVVSGVAQFSKVKTNHHKLAPSSIACSDQPRTTRW